MPRGDGSGPTGQGPMTGRGAGYCVGPADVPPARGFFGRGLRRGAGRGFGFRGAGYGPVAPGYYDPETDKRFLSDRADALTAELDRVKRLLKDTGSSES